MSLNLPPADQIRSLKQLISISLLATLGWCCAATAMAQEEGAAGEEAVEAAVDAAAEAAPDAVEAVEAEPAEEKATEEMAEEAAEEESEEASEEEAEAAEEEASEEKAMEEKPAASEPESKAGPAAAAFDATFTRWKELLKTLRDVRTQYAVAEESELPGLKEQWKQRIEDGNTLKVELDAAAMAAYAEAPNEDRELVRYLMTVAADNIRADEYQPAKELLQTLIDGGCNEKVLPDLAGIAAFCTNDFDAAAKYFEEAKENNALSRQSTNYMGESKAARKSGRRR